MQVVRTRGVKSDPDRIIPVSFEKTDHKKHGQVVVPLPPRHIACPCRSCYLKYLEAAYSNHESYYIRNHRNSSESAGSYLKEEQEILNEHNLLKSRVTVKSPTSPKVKIEPIEQSSTEEDDSVE